MFVIWPRNGSKIRLLDALLFPLIVVFTVFATITCVLAEGSCVQCRDPQATYRCTVSGHVGESDHAAGMYCASRLAADQQHTSCSVVPLNEGCPDAIPVEYADGPAASLPLQESYESEDAKLEPKAGAGEPETLGEFAKDAVEGSKKAGETIGNAANDAGKATVGAIKDAGEAVGNATKKTLKCLATALNDC